jgi:hypothetical protein
MDEFLCRSLYFKKLWCRKVWISSPSGPIRTVDRESCTLIPHNFSWRWMQHVAPKCLLRGPHLNGIIAQQLNDYIPFNKAYGEHYFLKSWKLFSWPKIFYGTWLSIAPVAIGPCCESLESILHTCLLLGTLKPGTSVTSAQNTAFQILNRFIPSLLCFRAPEILTFEFHAH